MMGPGFAESIADGLGCALFAFAAATFFAGMVVGALFL